VTTVAGSNNVDWAFWSATIGLESPIPARIAAAVAGGFSRVSIGPSDIVRAVAEGTSLADISRALCDADLKVVVDPVMNWYGHVPPILGFEVPSVDDVFRMCEALPVESISVIGPFTADEVPTESLGERFVAFCRGAAAVGARVQVEFMPMTWVTDLSRAWGFVQDADVSVGGIMFDVWHFFRGNPDYAALEALPGERIFGVQVSDASAEPQGSVNEETFNRLMPGDGGLDLVGVIQALDRIGGLRGVGPEVLSPATAAMDPAEAGEKTGTLVKDLIATARAGA
jgi:sugar phosphate isomerase/epimerase